MASRKSFGVMTAMVIAASGCHTKAPVVSRTSAEVKAAQAGAAANGEAKKELVQTLDEQYQKAFDDCQVEGDMLRNKVHRSSRADLTVTTLGIVAGSIVVPALAAKAAAKSVIAAWGGVSGSANAYQYAKSQEGLGPAQYAAIYTAMTNNMMSAMNSYAAAGSDPTKMRVAINQLILACQFPSSAEIAAMSTPRPPDAPQKAVFQPDPSKAGSGTILITPPDDDRGQTIMDYVVAFTPAGPVADHASFSDPKAPTISVSNLVPGTAYQVLIQSKNNVGAGQPLVFKFIP